MWTIAGLVDVLERKGLLTKQGGTRSHLYLRRHTPSAHQASPPLEAIPEPYLMRDTEALLGKLQLLIDFGEQLGPSGGIQRRPAVGALQSHAATLSARRCGVPTSRETHPTVAAVQCVRRKS